MLFALSDGGQPTLALQQCWALALALDAGVHVLRVLRPEPGSMLIAPDVDLVPAERGVERCLLGARETKAWCDDALPEPLLSKRLLVSVGDFIRDAACRAAELDADFIVLSPGTGALGMTARTLARASSCPVLVARTWLREATMIAATELEDEQYSVLRQAARLGVRLGGAVAVHNVACLPLAFNFEMRGPAAGHGAKQFVRTLHRAEYRGGARRPF